MSTDGAAPGGAPKSPSELTKRVISALVLAPVVLFAVWWGGYVFAALAGGVSILILFEWTRLVSDDAARTVYGSYAVVVASVALSAIGLPDLALAPLAIGTAVALWRGHPWVARGLLYAGLAGVAMVALRGNSDVGLHAILFVLFVVWATDVMAYFTGRAIGGPKLWPAVSPKKTWSGAIGGVVGAVVFGLTIAWLAKAPHLVPVALVALVLSIASQLGDLYESHIKRLFGAKDSGTLIPGHGGIMDRVDGLVFAVVLAAVIGYVQAGGGNPAVGLLHW